MKIVMIVLCLVLVLQLSAIIINIPADQPTIQDGINVSVDVYNVKGQKVKHLMNEQLSVGQHSIEWNSKDSNNKAIASGIYFYKISAGKSSAMRKMLLLK